MPRSLTRVVRGVLATALVALALAGCGGGDDDDDGTATSPVESTAAIEESPTPSVLTESSPVDGVSSEASGAASTPGAATPTPAIVVSAPPVVIPTPRPAEATPVGPGSPATPIVATASIAMGDGTGGPMAEPAPGGTPAAGGTPVAAVTVDSCEVAELPEYTGQDPVQVTSVDVNVRSGPGVDCDTVGQPVPGGVSVEVLSNPVQREGDEFTWVAVSIDGEEGWLAVDFLEPAN